MGQSLIQISEKLRNSDKTAQLIYAFNGIGKTRLSREFRLLVAPKVEEDVEETGIKVLYYNAFTEDLFYWDNDLDADVNRKLIIRPNGFTNMVLKFLKDQGLDGNIISNFQHYTSDKLTPSFNEEYMIKDENNNDIVIKAYSETTFSIKAGNEERIENIKISKAEESNLIWCVFYSLLEQVVELLNIPEHQNRSTDKFNDFGLHDASSPFINRKDLDIFAALNFFGLSFGVNGGVAANKEKDSLLVDLYKIEYGIGSVDSGFDSTDFVVEFSGFGETEDNDFVGSVGVVKQMERTGVNL